MTDRAGEERPLTMYPRPPRRLLPLKSSMRAAAAAAGARECDRLIFFGEQGDERNPGTVMRRRGLNTLLREEEFSIGSRSQRAGFNNIQSRQPLSSPLKAEDSLMSGESGAAFPRSKVKSY